MSSPETVLIQHRQKKLDEIRAMGVDPYPHKFAFDATVSETVTRYATMDHTQLDAESHHVRTCGRIMALRGFGKAAFCHISDGVEKMSGVGAISTSRPGFPTPARLKNAVVSETRAACCMLCVTMTIV